LRDSTADAASQNQGRLIYWDIGDTSVYPRIDTPCHTLEIILGELIASFGSTGSLSLSIAGLGHILLNFCGAEVLLLLTALRISGAKAAFR